MKKCSAHNQNCQNCEYDYCLQTVPFLSSLEPDQIKEVSKDTVRKRYKKGERIFSEGETARKLYMICTGKVKIFRYTPDGKELILYILSPNYFSFIGAFNLLKETTFDFGAEALEDTVVCTLDKHQFENIILKYPKVTLKILEEAYDRINKIESLVYRLSTNNVDAKVAGLLLSLIKDFGVEADDGIHLNMTMNREEMGSYAGLTRETMSRKLRSMQKQGLIEIQGNKKIIVKDINNLNDMLL
ncbi:Crp/Fnr family transcriptional regulator [Oceanirhabdus sp. W0125-5]|uniref:Crp/Fnr family transcriptional regulator n=1 Tax=Oceanirhabdus sp. W0125-5 TaxID=2999116 RepID=UPI0022F2F5C7|nr:Crp/Fnr family transcriptional regulator [Oceanirhabdus sp. W0125-5]WBW97409.1 Crp/Fnr family transcriptional regulator [Oceanirhabdus sp. W0125-5]